MEYVYKIIVYFILEKINNRIKYMKIILVVNILDKYIILYKHTL